MLGLNTITRRGEIGTSCPVFGLRPTRSPFDRTMNEPKDESFTDSPRITQAQLKFAGLNLDFSIAKARTKLGYAPRVLFDEGMKQALDWYRAQK